MAKLWFLIERVCLPHIIAAVTALFLFSPDMSLAEEKYSAWPGEFLRMGVGARAMGMGNAYTAVEGDIYSSYFNPAGLAAMRERQLALSIRYLSMDRKFMHLVYGNRIGPDADFAISWIQAGTDEIISRDLNGNPTGSLEDKRNAIYLTFSKNLNRWFSFGINTKLALWKLGGENAKAYGFDVGTVVRPVKKLALSFVIRDINSRFTWKTERWNEKFSSGEGQPMEKKDEFPVYYTLGLAYRLYMDKLLLSAALESVEDNPIGLNVGVSFDLTERFTLRTGIYNFTSSDELNSGSYTFGFTLGVTNSMDFDYAYVPDAFANDSFHTISLVMSYGE